MKWANVLEEAPKKITKAKRSLSPPRQLVHGCMWVPRTFSPSEESLYYKGPALQGIILEFFLGVPFIEPRGEGTVFITQQVVGRASPTARLSSFTASFCICAPSSQEALPE